MAKVVFPAPFGPAMRMHVFTMQTYRRPGGVSSALTGGHPTGPTPRRGKNRPAMGVAAAGKFGLRRRHASPLQGSGCRGAVDPGRRSPAGSLALGYYASALQAGWETSGWNRLDVGLWKIYPLPGSLLMRVSHSIPHSSHTNSWILSLSSTLLSEDLPHWGHFMRFRRVCWRT